MSLSFYLSSYILLVCLVCVCLCICVLFLLPTHAHTPGAFTSPAIRPSYLQLLKGLSSALNARLFHQPPVIFTLGRSLSALTVLCLEVRTVLFVCRLHHHWPMLPCCASQELNPHHLLRPRSAPRRCNMQTARIKMADIWWKVSNKACTESRHNMLEHWDGLQWWPSLFW